MVRRWSRINTSNCADYFDYNIAYRVHHLKVFRTTTYFKRFYFGWTKQKRRKSARKKRLSYLTPYMNVIGMWAKDYRFFRHVTRFNYTSNVFLVNYLANNNVSYANIQTLHSLKFDSFITASYANRVSRYYTRQQLMSFFVNKYTRHALLHSLSTPDPSILLNLDERDRSVTPLGYFYQNEVYDLEAPLTGTDTLPMLFTGVFNHHLTQLVLIYRVLILTYLNTLKF
jgi:hypothetical protein